MTNGVHREYIIDFPFSECRIRIMLCLCLYSNSMFAYKICIVGVTSVCNSMFANQMCIPGCIPGLVVLSKVFFYTNKTILLRKLNVQVTSTGNVPSCSFLLLWQNTKEVSKKTEDLMVYNGALDYPGDQA